MVTGFVHDASRRAVEHMLAPTLQPGYVVVMDNLPAHKVAASGKHWGARSKLLYLPPFSPDFKPDRKRLRQVQALRNAVAGRVALSARHRGRSSGRSCLISWTQSPPHDGLDTTTGWAGMTTASTHERTLVLNRRGPLLTASLKLRSRRFRLTLRRYIKCYQFGVRTKGCRHGFGGCCSVCTAARCTRPCGSGADRALLWAAQRSRSRVRHALRSPCSSEPVQ